MPSSPRLTSTAVLAVVLTGASLLAACGDDDAGDTDAFCQRVAEDQELLFTTPLSSIEEARALVRAYERAGAVAPLAIDAEWQAMTDLYESMVNATVPFDDGDIAPVYASQNSALAIAAWLDENCSIEITVATVPDPLPRPDATALGPASTG